MNNTASRIIRSEEITIDMRICTILAGGKKPGEVYFAAIAPDMELTVITLDEVPDILPCFDESDVSINLPDTSLLLTYNPAQVLKLAGKRYLTGPVILVRTNMILSTPSYSPEKIGASMMITARARAIKNRTMFLLVESQPST